MSVRRRDGYQTCGRIFNGNQGGSVPKTKGSKTNGNKTKNSGFMKPMRPSAQLAKIVGEEPLPRSEVTKKVWEHIKKNNLQDKTNKRMINADEKTRPLFGKDQISMFDLAKIVNNHIKR